MSTIARVSSVTKGYFDKVNKKDPFVLVCLTVKVEHETELGISFNNMPYGIKFEDVPAKKFKAFSVLPKLEGKEFMEVDLLERWLIRPKSENDAGRKEARFVSFVQGDSKLQEAEKVEDDSREESPF